MINVFWHVHLSTYMCSSGQAAIGPCDALVMLMHEGQGASCGGPDTTVQSYTNANRLRVPAGCADAGGRSQLQLLRSCGTGLAAVAAMNVLLHSGAASAADPSDLSQHHHAANAVFGASICSTF